MNQPTCVNTSIEYAFRGMFLGVTWTTFEAVKAVRLDPQSVTPREYVSVSLAAGLRCGAGIAVYSGMTCCMEALTGRQHWSNGFIGGATTGVALAATSKQMIRSTTSIGQAALLAGVLGGAITFFRVQTQAAKR